MSPNRRVGLVIIVTLLIPLLPFAVIGELPGERWLSSADDSAFAFGLAGAGLLAADVLLPIPSSILGTMLGARLGAPAGFLWTFAGLLTGHIIGYGVGRLILGRAGATLPETPTLLAIFLSRPVPVLAEAACMTSGAARTPFSHFFIACAAGNVIYAAALAANGALLLPGAWTGPGLVIPMLLPVAGWLVWRRLESRRRSTERR
jgi:uncharacterized membrane protein YdjX (TVP38/TMEM64 family)